MAASTTGAGAAAALAKGMASARLTTVDPALFQIITAPNSHLARGEFGLKSNIRPAIVAAEHGKAGAVRYVQVRDMDSQAGIGLDWKEREHEALLLKRWQEADVAVRDPELPRDYGAASGGTHHVIQPQPQSRFDRGSRRALRTEKGASAKRVVATNYVQYSQSAATMPNYQLYSEKRFEHLLSTVRSNRKTFLREMRRAGGPQRRPALASGSTAPEATQQASESATQAAASPSIDMYDLARHRESTYNGVSHLRDVIGRLSMEGAKSTVLPMQRQPSGSSAAAAGIVASARSRLHPLGGLQYSQPDAVVSAIGSSALPGRVIGNSKGLQGPRSNRKYGGRSQDDNAYLVAIGSRVVASAVRDAAGLRPFDNTGVNSSLGTGLFRLHGAELIQKEPGNLTSVDRRISERNANWDIDEVDALQLGYIKAGATNVLDKESKRNEVFANSPVDRLPGTPHWATRHQGEVDDKYAQQQRLSWMTSRLRSGQQASAGASAFLGLSGGDRSSGQTAVDARSGSLAGRRGGFEQRVPIGGGSSSRIAMTKDNPASRRAAALRGEGNGGAQSGAAEQESSRTQSVSDLLGLKP